MDAQFDDILTDALVTFVQPPAKLKVDEPLTAEVRYHTSNDTLPDATSVLITMLLTLIP